MTGPHVHRLSTHGVPAQDQFDAWQDMLSRALYPVRVRPLAGGPHRFRADFLARRTDGATITRGVLDPMRTSVPTVPARSLQLVMHTGGPRYVEARRALTELPANRLLVQTSDEPCTHIHAGTHEVVLLNVPLGALSLELATLRRLMFRPLEVPGPARSALRSAAAHVLGEDGGLPGVAVHHYLLGVAELLLRSVLGAELDHAGTTEARRRQALDYLAAHLTDTGLTAQHVAEALHMSRRRLYQLFDGELGVRGTIREMRVAKARRLLADSECAWSVDQVARACGFASRSHFSRTFSLATGTSPREYRAQRNESARDE